MERHESIEDAINALREVDDVIESNGGRPQIEEVARKLHAKTTNEPNGGRFRSIRYHVAEAILRAYLHKDIKDL